MSAVEIRENLFWVGALDPDLRIFDVVMKTKYGTSYNSYLLKTPRYKVLFETVKDRFFDTFMHNMKEVCDPSELDYIICNHTEPDHAGSLGKLLNYAPKAKVMASPIALNFLKDISNHDIPGTPVSDDQVLELDTCKLHFLSVPFLHWPDSIYTYIEGMDVLVTCDSFGCHYSDDRICNDLIDGNFEPAYKYYFDMIMGPFKSHVRYALDRISGLDVKTVCPGHGPVLRKDIDHYIKLYEEWSREEEHKRASKPKVVSVFVSAYGYTERLAHEIADAVRKEIDSDIILYDMVHADPEKVLSEMKEADGLLVGSPTINGDALPPVMDLLMKMNGISDGGKVAAAYGSYGWSGEAADMLSARLKVLRMELVEPTLKINFNPEDGPKLEAARAFGRKFGRKLKEKWESFKMDDSGKKYWKCTVCGEVFEGALPPLTCPVCGAGREAFIEYVPEKVDFHKNSAVKIVIIGSGAAAISAAEAARQRNDDAQIDVYSREKVYPYYRPVLTKAIKEKVGDDEYLMNPVNFYEKNRISLHLDSELVSIHPRSKEVEFKDGAKCSYDKLLLATGARCFIPPIKGFDLPQVIALREQTDFDKLAELTKGPSKRIVIIGGGLLGLETADALTRSGHSVTVIEACPAILPRQLDAEGGRMMERIIRKASSVDVRLGIFVDEVCGGDSVASVKTKRDEQIPCDIVVISAGIRSNIEIAKAAGIETERAMIVDDRMRTSEPDIYAAGDCAMFGERCDGIWETALEQGKVAGADMVGDDVRYEPRMYGATLHAFGTQLFSLGDLGNDEDAGYVQVASRDELNDRYKKLYFREGRLVGGILLGDVSLTNPLLSGVTGAVDAEGAADLKLL